MSKKVITDELIEKKMISYGFGEVDSHDEDHVRKVVCRHYDLEITDDWSNDCDHYIYEETTADGYSVWVSTYKQNKVCVSENVFYYDNDLADDIILSNLTGNGYNTELVRLLAEYGALGKNGSALADAVLGTRFTAFDKSILT